MTRSDSPGGEDFSRLMRAAQDGDGNAYASLLTELLPLLRRVIGARGGFDNEADLEDVVQEVLISVHEVRATYDPRRPFLPWLLAITRHRIADARRRHYRGTAREADLERADVTSIAATPNPELEQAENREELLRAIEQLPAGQRQAITLLKMQELSLTEASARTGVSEGALKVATHRAMLALRKLLPKP